MLIQTTGHISLIRTGLTVNEARVFEQALILAFTIDKLENRINSISRKKIGATKFKDAATTLQLQSSFLEDELYEKANGN